MNNIGDFINTAEFKKGRYFDCNVTQSQLVGGNINRYWSWGARNLTFFGNKPSDSYAFRLRVSGKHHKGYVYIALNGLDLYDIYYTNLKGLIKNVDSDIYGDEIAEIVDKRIEWVRTYKH